MGDLLLVRHGETAWSLSGRHTGLTDLPLTGHGEQQARALASSLSTRPYALVLTSPLQRARRTAELAGLDAETDDDLREWDYGSYEGQTTPQIHEQRPDWDVFTHGAPRGESPARIEARCRRVVEHVRASLQDGDVLVVAHGHLLRALGAVWADLPLSAGGALLLDAASTCRLGEHHGRPAIRSWNVPVTA